jgi:hypothetical protein
MQPVQLIAGEALPLSQEVQTLTAHHSAGTRGPEQVTHDFSLAIGRKLKLRRGP